jgi:hypothetical protein
MKLLSILFLCFIGTVNAYSGTIDPNTPDSKYIEYGKKFTYVGSLCGSYENGDLFCASAVAIDDHHILTAAHVVEGAKICIFSLEKSPYKIETIIIHKDFGKKKHILDLSKSDIALCYSEKPFGLKFYPCLYENSDEQSKLSCIAGYGFTGNFISGAKIYDGIKRAGSNFIDIVKDDNLLICSPSKRNDKDFTSLEFLIASGDSGGGLFIDGKLAGINSCIMATGSNPKSGYNEESGHTRISKFIDWIKENKK